MTPELESRIEAWLFNELTADERTAFDRELAQSPDLQALVAEREELQLLMRRAFLRGKVQQATAENALAARPEARIVSLRPVFRMAAAAALATVLAGAAWFLWRQTNELEKEMAKMEREKLELQEILAAEKKENDQPNSAKSPQKLPPPTKSPRTNQPQIAQNQPSKNEAPVVYNEQIRGNEPVAQSSKGESFYRAIYQKPDLRRFESTDFQGFIKFFNQQKYADALRLLGQMEVKPTGEDSRDFLRGLAHLELNEPSNAINSFSSLYQPSNSFYADVQWWLALSFARQGKFETAKEIFSKISKTAGHPFQAAAIEALSKI